MQDVSYIVAFGSGLLSFFTPCIIPLLPLYFGYLAGETIQNIEDKKIHRKLLTNTGAFVLGLTSLNIMLGFGAKAASDLLLRYSDGLRIAGGILLVLFGLYFIFGLRLRFMETEHKIHMRKYTPSFLKSFLLGITFSFGWTPCNGPIIATILMMASFQKDYLAAGSLMLVYSLGFAVMFMMAALLVGLFMKKVKGIYKYFKWIKLAAGLLMIGMGYLMITNQISLLVF